MTTTKVATKLICADCRHENEPERIYCHNCGARLDRTAVIKEKAAIDESGAHARKHLEKMFAPGRGRWKRAGGKFGKLLLGAICFAGVLQMLLPPDWPPEQKQVNFAPLINMDLSMALQGHQPAQLLYSEEQVNGYLASSIGRSKSPAKEGYAPLRRMFVKFEEGICRVSIERRILGVSLRAGSSYRVTVEGGRIASAITAGHVGRMPIHPAVMKGIEPLLFPKAWETLARERKDVARLAGVEFHPQSVALRVAP